VPTATPRQVALDALLRIEDGAYANLVLPSLLARSGLDERDRGFVTELVYGTTRMLRACDWLLERFLFREVDPDVAAILRLGAYQLAFLQTPAHAAVGETVDLASGRTKGFVNAVLRKVAAAGPPRPDEWPDDATRLSYPDWVVDRLVTDLGHDAALAALAQMNEAASVTTRDDGYIQDEASQQVAALVGVEPGQRVADLCAAPGGKSTLLATAGATLVAAGDLNPTRTGLVAGNARRLGADAVAPYVGDARTPPLRDGHFDCVLLDAPCSGLGVLRRRPDARWRVSPRDVDDLARLQRDLLERAIGLVRPGGVLVYSVCTLTKAETEDADAWLAAEHPELEPEPAPPAPWEPVGRGGRLLPQTIGSDGMYVLRLRRPVGKLSGS
jgi:16S rRNA (cytosine967-C5)-methyltransferase